MLRTRTGRLASVEPCLPTKADTLPSGGLWLHEIKHDGFRVQRPGLSYENMRRANLWHTQGGVDLLRIMVFTTPTSSSTPSYTCRGHISLNYLPSWMSKKRAISSKTSLDLRCADVTG